jgi:hypothetical protein
MLSTVLCANNKAAWTALREEGLAYLPSHQHHPCTVWAGECINNYLWLCRLGLELCAEYTYRFGERPAKPGMAPPAVPRRHASERVMAALRAHAPLLPDKRVITPFALAMPEEYRVAGDPVASYRRYYREAKAAFARYTRREAPDWLAAALL